MHKKFSRFEICMIAAGILVLLFPVFAFSQDSKAPGKSTAPVPGEAAQKTAAVSGFLRDVVIVSRPKGIKIKLTGEGLSSAFHKFDLRSPARLVIDFPGAVISFPKKFIDVGHPLLKEIRIGRHPEKIRVVFLFPETQIPVHRLLKESQGLSLWIGEVEKELEEAEKPAREGGPEPPKIESSGEKDRPLAEAKGEAEKAPLKPQTRNKVSLDFKDGDIRGVLRLISQAAQKTIIPSDEVQGTVTLRLVDVPWDQALDAILSICNLRKIEEGDLIRILPK